MKKTPRRWSGLPWEGDIIYAVGGSCIFLIIANIIRSVVGLPISTPTEEGIENCSWIAFTICEIIFIIWAHAVDDQEYLRYFLPSMIVLLIVIVGIYLIP